MSELHDLAALYVVDALIADEIHEFEVHLAECLTCQKEVTDMRRVTEKLSRSVQAEPPPSLRTAVLARISETSQEPASLTSTTAPAPASGPQVRGNVVPLKPREPSRLPYLVAAAAVLLALGFGGWALQSHQDVNEANNQYAEMAQLLSAPDVRTVSASVPGGGSASVVISRTRGEALFVAAGMPTLANNKVYELWTVTTVPARAGTFTPSTSPAVVSLPAAALSASRIAISVEPDGGSDKPTTQLVLSVRVPRTT